MASNHQQISVPDSLDVESIERVLAGLWEQTGVHNQAVGDEAVLRARTADLMVFVSDEALLTDTHQIISELASFHPCRALLMAGDRNATARDIEMYVSAFCPNQKPSESKSLCCEEITLTAQGRFVSELPSAALPLLVPDLPVFLWWREKPGVEEKLFNQLRLAADRVVIDSADFQDPPSDLSAVAQLVSRRGEEGIVLSDINWARLTFWRASLANFYDVEDYRAALDQLTDVRIDFVAEKTGATISSQALLIVGWLASRLNWKLSGEMEPRSSPRGLACHLKKNHQLIKLSFNEVQLPSMKPGRLSQIELNSSGVPATFRVSRGEDGLHLETHTTISGRSYPGRLLPIRNWSAAKLLSREMEILCNDKVYEEATKAAAELMKQSHLKK